MSKSSSKQKYEQLMDWLVYLGNQKKLKQKYARTKK